MWNADPFLSELRWIRDLLNKSKFIVAIGSKTYVIINPSMSFVWNDQGQLTEVRVSGYDSEGNLRPFKQTLSWSSEGFLQNVSPWQEVNS